MCDCRTVCMYRITEWRCPIAGELRDAPERLASLGPHFAALREAWLRERAGRIGGGE